METIINATDAQLHFGKLLHEVIDSQKIILVASEEGPLVVMLSLAEYRRLKPMSSTTSWQATLAQATRVRTQIAARLGNQSLTSATEVIRQAREERDEQFSDLC